MPYLYIFLIALTFVCNFGALYFSYKIMRISVTPTFTWQLLTLAFLIRIIQQAIGVFYTRQVLDFYQSFDSWVIISTQLMQMLTVLFFFVAIGRIYFGLKGLLDTHSKQPKT